MLAYNNVYSIVQIEYFQINFIGLMQRKCQSTE